MTRLLDLIVRALRWTASNAGRTWLYGIAIAAIPLGIALGWFTKETGGLLVPLIVAVLHVPGQIDRLRLRDLDAD